MKEERGGGVVGCSPGILHWREGDITIWADLQNTMLRLDADTEELDVLRRVGTHTCVLLHTGGRTDRQTDRQTDR